jgi:hypothetical protein
MMRKLTILRKLATALNQCTDGVFGMPIIKTKKADGWDCDTLCWDGPFEWINFSMETSIYASEIGNYSLPMEPELKEILELAKENGYYFEPNNNCQMCLAD